MQMKRKSFILPFVLVALIAVSALSGCNGNTGPGDSPDSAQIIGQGGTVFRFEVTDDTETVTAWDVHTDETTVGAALLEVGLIAGDMFSFGLMVTEVNGLTADFDADGAWWAFYIGGEMAAMGVDSTGIEPDTTYAFVYTTD
jgi:hypothetical protein